MITFLFSLGQSSKPKLPIVPEQPVLAQLKKVSLKVELKKSSSGELQLIKSPRGFKPSKGKIETVQKNFYESHSSKLLHQVENIDEKDIDNPQLLAEYVQDIYTYLFKLERQFMIRDNFLSSQMDVIDICSRPRLLRDVTCSWLG